TIGVPFGSPFPLLYLTAAVVVCTSVRARTRGRQIGFVGDPVARRSRGRRACDRGTPAGETVRRPGDGGGPAGPVGAVRRDLRPARPQRRRQDDDPADAAGTGAADHGDDPGPG